MALHSRWSTSKDGLREALAVIHRQHGRDGEVRLRVLRSRLWAHGPFVSHPSPGSKQSCPAALGAGGTEPPSSTRLPPVEGLSRRRELVRSECDDAVRRKASWQRCPSPCQERLCHSRRNETAGQRLGELRMSPLGVSEASERPTSGERREDEKRGTPDQANAASQAAVWSGQGRGRTADLPIFSRTLVPTELPGRCLQDRGPSGRAEPYRSDPGPTKTVRDPDSLMLIRVSGPHRLAAQDPALSRR
jgi:hypothetical protein